MYYLKLSNKSIADNVGYVPFKRAIPAAVAIPALATAGSALIGGISSLVSNSNVNKANKDINDKNIEFQRETNKQNLDFAREQMKWQEYQEQKQWDRQVAYDNPSALRSRLSAAGVNPDYVFGQGVSGMMGNPQAVGSGVTNPTYHGIAPQLQFTDKPTNSIEAISAIASVIESLSKAKLNDSESNRINKTLTAEIENIIANTKNQVAKTELTQLQTSLEKIFAPFERSAKLNKTVQEAKNIIQDTFLKVSQGELIDAQKVTEETKQALNNALTSLHGKQKEYVQLEIDWFVPQMKATINELNTRSKRNVAAARESNSVASINEQILPYVERLEAAKARLAENDAAFKDQTFINRVYQSANELLQSDYITEIQKTQVDYWKEELERAQKENNVFYYRFVLDKLNDIARTVADYIPKTSVSTESGYDDIRGAYSSEKRKRETRR